jgi:4,5-dihydroxyphthalate decarboxylase
MTMNDKARLFTLLGDYPNTLPIKEGLVPSDLVDFAFADIKVANTGFKPLVREHKFDLGELAIVTYLQAKAYGKPYVLLPAPIVARGQHHTIAYNPEHGELTPERLERKRVGVRAYTVTTGVWVRAILHSQFGVNLDKVHWVTFEEPHLAEYTDPPVIERAAAGKSMVQMLLDGELDAAVVGDKLPDQRLRLLIPDYDKAAQAWEEQHGMPLNHLLVIRDELSQQRPEVIREVFRVFKVAKEIAARNGNKNAAQITFGVEANRRALQTVIESAFDQKLLPRRFSVDELFDDLTRGLY